MRRPFPQRVLPAVTLEPCELSDGVSVGEEFRRIRARRKLAAEFAAADARVRAAQAERHARRAR